MNVLELRMLLKALHPLQITVPMFELNGVPGGFLIALPIPVQPDLQIASSIGSLEKVDGCFHDSF